MSASLLAATGSEETPKKRQSRLEDCQWFFFCHSAVLIECLNRISSGKKENHSEVLCSSACRVEVTICNGRQLPSDSATQSDSERDRHGRAVASPGRCLTKRIIRLVVSQRQVVSRKTSCFTKDNCSHFLLLTDGHPKHAPFDAHRRIPDRTCGVLPHFHLWAETAETALTKSQRNRLCDG